MTASPVLNWDLEYDSEYDYQQAFSDMQGVQRHHKTVPGVYTDALLDNLTVANEP